MLFQSRNRSDVVEAHATHSDVDVFEAIAPEATRSATVTRHEKEDARAVSAAAVLGGEYAVQFIVALLHSPPNDTHKFSWQLVH